MQNTKKRFYYYYSFIFQVRSLFLIRPFIELLQHCLSLSLAGQHHLFESSNWTRCVLIYAVLWVMSTPWVWITLGSNFDPSVIYEKQAFHNELVMDLRPAIFNAETRLYHL